METPSIPTEEMIASIAVEQTTNFIVDAIENLEHYHFVEELMEIIEYKYGVDVADAVNETVEDIVRTILRETAVDMWSTIKEENYVWRFEDVIRKAINESTEE